MSATPPTLVGPTQSSQFNHELFVGKSPFTTIQQAVNAAVIDDTNYTVIIPSDYTGSDQVSGVVGGTTNVAIIDMRGDVPKHYQWSASTAKYIGPVQDLNGVLLASSTLDMQQNYLAISGTALPPIGGNGFTPTGYLGLGGINGQDTTGTTGQTAGNGGKTYLWAGHGGAAPAGSINGDGGDLSITAGYAGKGAGTPGTPGDVHIQDPTGSDVEYGNTYIGGGDIDTATIIQPGGDLSAPNLSAGGADFDTCMVNGSAVRTFANSGGGGISYPPAGIAVSNGNDAWQASIDPATIPRLASNNTFTGANIFNGANQFTGTLDVSNDGNGVTNLHRGVLNVGWSQFTDGGTGALQINSGLAIYFNWATGNSGVHFGNGSGTEVAAIDGTGNFKCSGQASILGRVTANFAVPGIFAGLGPDGVTPTFYLSVTGNSDSNMQFYKTGGSAQFQVLDHTGAVISTPFEMFDTGSCTVGGNLFCQHLVATENGATMTIQGNDTTVDNTNSGTCIGWNYLNGGGETDFFNFMSSAGVGGGFNWYNSLVGTSPTAAGWLMRLDKNGLLSTIDLNVSGTFTAGTKNFRIVHPLDKSKTLTHSCIEGPEAAVFYRGEGQTDEEGRATITLPDYFEALTRPEGRTVMLTELFDDDDENEMGKLAASRVKDGKFTVRSEYISMKFYWEVKAVRADVDPLEVVANLH